MEYGANKTCVYLRQSNRWKKLLGDLRENWLR